MSMMRRSQWEMLTCSRNLLKKVNKLQAKKINKISKNLNKNKKMSNKLIKPKLSTQLKILNSNNRNLKPKMLSLKHKK